MRARLTCVVVVCAAIALAPAARAAPETLVALEYELEPDTAGCPDEAEFRGRVERQLGYDPFRSIADRRVAVQVARRGGGFEGRIRWSDDRGRWVGDRRLASRRPGCEEIAANLAFSVAVQIQLLSALAPPTVAAAPPPAEVRPAPPPVAPSPPPAPPPRWLALSLGLGPAVALGLAPAPTGLGRIFADGRAGWVSLELALDAALPASQREPDGSGFSLARFDAGLAACAHARALAACALGTLGLLRARGFGVDAPASPFGLTGQVGARLAATRALGGHLFLTARVDGLVTPVARTVMLNDTPVWTTPRVAATVGLDLGARIF
ncbi:MAG TPA: hypothetical protein VKZ18_26870 [Polyangia bacterium]|nr:hypothetical protein [Polyangia bacterium]